MANFVTTGGLTGGHVMPCLTVALRLAERGHAVLHVGASGELEERMCARYGIEFAGLAYPRARHRASRWRALARAIPIAAGVLRRFHASAVFSKGSQVSVPVVTAARMLGVPVVLHESDLVAGSENRLVAPLCTVLCVGWSEAGAPFRRPSRTTGNIVGPSALHVYDQRGARRALGVPEEKPLVLVLGGSQGALTLNRLVYPIVPALCAQYSVLHQCGPRKLEPLAHHVGYVQREWIQDMGEAYSAADLVVSRAGATTMAEVAARRLPAIYIPFPWAEGDHQVLNAKRAAALGTAEVVYQDDPTPERLRDVIERVMAARASYVAAHETSPVFDGTMSVIDILEETAATPTRLMRRPGAVFRMERGKDS